MHLSNFCLQRQKVRVSCAKWCLNTLPTLISIVKCSRHGSMMSAGMRDNNTGMREGTMVRGMSVHAMRMHFTSARVPLLQRVLHAICQIC